MRTETGLQHQRVHPDRGQDTYSTDPRSVQETGSEPGHQSSIHNTAGTRGSSLSLAEFLRLGQRVGDVVGVSLPTDEAGQDDYDQLLPSRPDV